MRIAFSGAHRTGKSSLLEALAERLPRYETVDEPYDLLEEDGYEHAHPPSLEDFEAQLERSVDELNRPRPDVLFDRCPADLLAYIGAHDDGGDTELTEAVRAAMESLDLVVFVPVEPGADAYREAVDEGLERLLGAFDVDVLTVHGTTAQRLAQVLARLSA